MSRVVTSLCSIPSFGTFGTPTFFGGPVGSLGSSTALTDAQIAALGERADVTGTGGAMPATRTPYYANFTSNGVVWFDGFAALYALGLHADHKDFAISFWYNPYEETTDILKGAQPHGAVFCNCGVNERRVDGFWITENFQFRYTSNNVSQPTDPICGGVMPGTHNGDHVTNGGAPQSVSFGSSNLSFTTYPTSSIDDMQGWCHVMGGVHTVSGRKKITVYVNDTAIISDAQMNDSAFWGNASHINDEDFTMRFSAPTFTDPNGDYGSPGAVSVPWCVGGRFDGSNLGEGTLMTDGSGMQGAIMEMWIAPGQYIDWSNSSNRLKFHDVDITGTHWAPVNLGSKGATPTGTSPQYYFTGGPDKFPINRASGKLAKVWHRGTSFGLIDRLTEYSVLPF